MFMAQAGSRFNKDTVVGVTAAVILVAAMAGVFLYERAQFQEYAVSWERQSVQTEEFSQTLSEGDSATHAVEATTSGMARLRAELTWSDGVGQADTFTLAVEAPNGTSVDDSGDSGTIELTPTVTPKPDLETASGRSLAEARQQVNASLSSTAGQGNWTVTVTLDDAPGTSGTGGVGSQEDGAQDYTLTVDVERWTARLESMG